MKKKTLLLNTTLAGALAFSTLVPSVLAHDALELGVGNKGEETYVYSMEELQAMQLGYTSWGSKNVKHLREAASVQIQKLNGNQNNTADVYAHKGFAYLGTHTANGANGGVRVFDLKDPSNPVEVAVFAHDDVPNTWQEKVIVKSVNTPHFKGDLAVVSVQQRNRLADTAGGFLLYDVTNPYEPKKLGYWETYDKTTGTHELYLATQGNRALVFTSNPYADYYSTTAYHEPLEKQQRDFQIVDVSNPAEPTTIWQFDPRTLPQIPSNFNGYHWSTTYTNAAGETKTRNRPVFNHSVITDNNAQYAYVSMWDLGTVIFDIKDPENPVYLGNTSYRDDQKGAAHSAALAKGGTILIETREVANPVGIDYENAYGYTRIFDIKDKTNPILLSEFTTDLTFDIPPTSAGRNTFAKTVHDPKVHGNTLYLSYYSGGVLAVDITDPSNPVEIGRYTPENADVWGVFVDRNYILASDMGQGLKVLVKNNAGGNSKK